MYVIKPHLKKLNRKINNDKLLNSSYSLHRNERISPFPKNLITKLNKRFSKLNYSRYPNFNNFYKILSKWLNVSKNNIYLTEGVSGAIKLLLETCSQEGKSNIIFPHPSFAMYEIYAKMFNLKSKKILYKKDNKLDFEKILSSIDKNTALIFLPNPNLPIDEIIDKNIILELIKVCNKKNVFLVLDEVYFSFSKVTYINQINKENNLFIMRSFSKAFGLAGIRLGYLIGNKNNINYVSKTRGGYESNTLSIEVATFFIENYHEVKRYIAEVKKGLNFLQTNLHKKNIKTLCNMNSCYLFIDLENSKIVSKIVNSLKKNKIYVRGNWSKPYDTGILVSAGPIYIMKIFLKHFLIILEKFK